MTTPNIIFITADQLRWDCLGCYGNDVIQTPHIDALAQSGVAFDNAYAAATLCVPSRQSILTGQYPSSHGARGNRSALPEDTPTFVSLLQASEYDTAAFGKMHFHPTYADYGFDVMQLAEQDGQGRKDDEYHTQYLAQHNLSDQWDVWDQVLTERQHAPDIYWHTYGARRSELPFEHYHTTWITDRAQEYLMVPERREKPFFTWISYIKPHHPFDPPAPYDTKYDPDHVPVPSPVDGWQQKPLLTVDGDPRNAYFDTRLMTEAQLKNIIAHYYGLISHIDDSIGQLVEILKAQGLYQNTLIVFTSDHGDYLGQYGLFLKHPNIPYDALAKVPLIFAGGALQSAQRRLDARVSLIDLFPTFLDLAQVDHATRYQGMNLLPLIHNRSVESNRTILIETEGTVRGIRQGDYKYLYDCATGLEELYNLQIDSNETENLAPIEPETVQKMRLCLLNMMIDCCWDRYAYVNEKYK